MFRVKLATVACPVAPCCLTDNRLQAPAAVTIITVRERRGGGGRTETRSHELKEAGGPRRAKEDSRFYDNSPWAHYLQVVIIHY